MKKTILCVNNQDARQRYLARMLMEDGGSVVLCEEFCPDIGGYDVVLLPVRLAGLDLEEITQKLREGQKVFGGNFPEEFKNACMEKRVRCYDYMKEETIAVRNAVAAAEGAVAEAIQLGDENLHGNRSLVIGYGRCGRILADKLQGMKSEVTILEEDEQKRAKAEAYGFKILRSSREIAKGDYTYLFNTVPALLLDKMRLEECKNHIVIIDIASGTGGVDYEYCKERGIRAKLCPGLPGKYAPKSSAGILYEYVKEKCR